MPSSTKSHLSRTEIPAPACIATRPGTVHSLAIPLPVWSIRCISQPSAGRITDRVCVTWVLQLTKGTVSVQRVQLDASGLLV